MGWFVFLEEIESLLCIPVVYIGEIRSLQVDGSTSYQHRVNLQISTFLLAVVRTASPLARSR